MPGSGNAIFMFEIAVFFAGFAAVDTVDDLVVGVTDIVGSRVFCGIEEVIVVGGTKVGTAGAIVVEFNMAGVSIVVTVGFVSVGD